MMHVALSYSVGIKQFTYFITELIWSQPSDSFTIDLCLIVYSFYGKEYLLDHMIHDNIGTSDTPFSELWASII